MLGIELQPCTDLSVIITSAYRIQPKWWWWWWWNCLFYRTL